MLTKKLFTASGDNETVGRKIEATDQILVFSLDDLSYALPLSIVIKVIHAIEFRHLPNAPEIISGIINLYGEIIPVADIRKRLGLAPREIDPDDRLIIAVSGQRKVAIVVDSVAGIRDMLPGKISEAAETLPFAEHIKGVAKTDDGLILIYDLVGFLSIEEEKELEKAIKSTIK
jgi:purine-binding chemotaxis protein CheW